MPIENNAELVAAVGEASRLIQEINDYVKDHPATGSMAKVRFPTGFLRTAAQHRVKLKFVPNMTLRKNLSYAAMTHDLLRWLLTRTTITGQAKDMLIKEAICIIGSMCESITIWPGQAGLGKSRSFSNRLIRFRELGVISAAEEEELNWVWEVRCREHLAGVQFQEWNHYTLGHWTRSIAAYKALRDGLDAWRAK